MMMRYGRRDAQKFNDERARRGFLDERSFGNMLLLRYEIMNAKLLQFYLH